MVKCPKCGDDIDYVVMLEPRLIETHLSLDAVGDPEHICKGEHDCEGRVHFECPKCHGSVAWSPDEAENLLKGSEGSEGSAGKMLPFVFVIWFDDGEVVTVAGVSTGDEALNQYARNVGKYEGRAFSIRRATHRIAVSKGKESPEKDEDNGSD